MQPTSFRLEFVSHLRPRGQYIRKPATAHVVLRRLRKHYAYLLLLLARDTTEA